MTTAEAERSPTVLRTTRRGEIKRWSETLIATIREAPADAETPSHVLLSRAGYIYRVGAGIYSYLPLAWRSLQKISDIVREEMEAAGASELLLPALHPIELYRQTGRDEAYGPTLFRLNDQHGRETALGPTHEEVITDIMKHAVNSYRQLPVTVYQIQTKFRDEFRPRAGLLRCREFIMKDAYSFSHRMEGVGGLADIYDRMYAAYSNSFRRCGLSFTVVEAESGPIGGSASHEFMVNAETGEDTILVCDASGYAANVEKCETGPRPWSFDGEPAGELEVVDTPGQTTIEDVCKFMKVKPRFMLKTIVFREEGGAGRWVLAIVRGDHDVNEGKVRSAAASIGGTGPAGTGFQPVNDGGTGFQPVRNLALAEEAEARAAGFSIGYVGPHSAAGRDDTILLIDPDAAQGTDAEKGKPMFWAAGANEKDRHAKFFNWRRELGSVLDDDSKVRVADIRNAMAGDPSPRAEGGTLREQRGIEVGHIFKLGCKYSDAMGLEVLNEAQQRQSVIMGCYGLGVSRTLAACVEMSHDENGIIFPPAIAPYHVLVTLMKVGDERQHEAADRLAAELADRGVDVLIDDRDERPGVKFKDADLIGIPIRLTIGDKALDQDAAEFKLRREQGKGDLVPLGEVAERCAAALEALNEVAQ